MSRVFFKFVDNLFVGEHVCDVCKTGDLFSYWRCGHCKVAMSLHSDLCNFFQDFDICFSCFEKKGKQVSDGFIGQFFTN